MKQIRFLAVVLLCLCGLTARRAVAQEPVSVQLLNFSLFNDYEGDRFATNATLTNEDSIIRTVLIDSANLRRGIYYESGPDWTNLGGMLLVREVNLTNGAEGIFLRGRGRQTNVSRYFTNVFGASYSGNFTGEIPSVFPPATNFPSALLIHRGFERFRQDQPPFTNNLRSERLFFVSLDTTNSKLNFLGYGTSVLHPVAGRINGVLYRTNVESFFSQGVGTMYFSGGSNVFFNPGIPSVTNSGPVHGTFWTGQPRFEMVTNGP